MEHSYLESYWRAFASSTQHGRDLLAEADRLGWSLYKNKTNFHYRLSNGGLQVTDGKPMHGEDGVYVTGVRCHLKSPKPWSRMVYVKAPVSSDGPMQEMKKMDQVLRVASMINDFLKTEGIGHVLEQDWLGGFDLVKCDR